MNHADHVELLKPGIPGTGGTWADLGAGTGAFTLALAELIGPTGHIYAVDIDRGALQRLKRSMHDHFPNVNLVTLAADFSQPLDLPPLDGIVMANSLHFVRHKTQLVAQIRAYLRPQGRLLLVEYDTDRGNTRVPFPLSYQSWELLTAEAGFARTQRLATRPSRFLGQIYSALSF